MGGKAKEAGYQRALNAMGAKCIEDIDDEFQIYLTDDKLARNVKLLLSMAKGAKIVSLKWFHACQKAGKLIVNKDIEKYYVFDNEFEASYQCNLKQIYTNDLSKLLENQKVYVSKNIKGVAKAQLETIVSAIGGIISNDRQLKTSNICIMDPENDAKQITELKKTKNHPHLVKIHYLLDGILKLKLSVADHSI